MKGVERLSRQGDRTMGGGEKEGWLPALGLRVLTPLYDLVVPWATRERAFKRWLLDRADLTGDSGERLEHEPLLRVLDLGCGTGTLLGMVVERRPDRIRAVGVDVDPAVLARARRRLIGAGRGPTRVWRTAVGVRGGAPREGRRTEGGRGRTVDGWGRARRGRVGPSPPWLVRARATRLPMPDARFDLVLSTLMLHHLTTEEKVEALREVRRVLRPGGRLLVADFGPPRNPLLRATFQIVRMLDGFERTADHQAGRLPERMERAGLVAVRETGSLATPSGRVCFYEARRAG